MSIEILRWFKPEEGHLPDTRRTVQTRTDDPEYPVWPSFYANGVWYEASGMPLRYPVIEWSEMPGGSGSLRRWRHPDGGTYTEVGRGLQRPLVTDPWTDAVMYVADKDGAWFARGTDYFEGRFEPIDKP